MRIVTCFVLATCIASVTAYSFGNTLSNCQNVVKRTSCIGFNRKNSFRTIDGTCNNLRKKTQGAARTVLARLQPADYVDRQKIDAPRGFPGTKPAVPTAHQVSRAVFQVQRKNQQRARGLSTLFMAFGQFIDHDIGLTPHPKCDVSKGCGSNSAFAYPCFPIKFTPKGSRCTSFARSIPVCQQGRRRKTREQINVLSSYLDLSQVYSNDKTILRKLRKLDGSGQLKVTRKNLLPIDVPASSPSCQNPAGCSLLGDSRGDENIALSSMHTIWVRHHNFIAKALKRRHRSWNERRLFETARKINIGIYQRIVYNEFLPPLVNAGRYRRYNSRVDASIVSVFSTAAFRFGHSLVPNAWALLNKNYNKAFNDISLQASFFDTRPLRRRGIEPIVYGLLKNQSQVVDTKFAFGIARRLFVPVGTRGYADLPALNIQRGRDNGIRTYGTWRKVCKLRRLRKWSDLIGLMPSSARTAFRKLYKHPNDIDIFAAGIAERHRGGKMLGETFQCIIKNQFQRLRNGDRLYFERAGVFTRRQRNELRKMTMAKVLCNTLKDVVSVQIKALKVFGYGNWRRECGSIRGANLKVW